MRDGLYPEEIHSGTMINGERVVRKSIGIDSNGRKVVFVQFMRTNRRGKMRLSEPVGYVSGTIVPGTRKPTTWHMPAGPVHRKPGTKQNGGWWGDGDATDRGSLADRHQRRIEAITYAD